MPPPPRPPSIAAVPHSRTRRLLHLGRAVGEMAAGAAAEGLGRLARGESLALAQLMLTPGNARRLAERLSAMRGAVMKLGQLMSMDGHGVLPPAFAELLGSLRDGAHAMPATQLVQVLEQAYGADWHRRFRRFSFAPVAAASIGQVHRAETHDGVVLALKIQYPGVRRSIDSDIANLALLARTPGLLPAGLDPAPLLERVREQLHRETDYLAEARLLMDYRERLRDAAGLWVPAVVPEHSGEHILATHFAPGVAVDRLAGGSPQAQRDAVATLLCRLALHEFFAMQLVQTDPNFGNYLFDAASGRVALLDFGATESVSAERVGQLRELAHAQRAGDALRVRAAAIAAGYADAADAAAQTDATVAMLLLAGEPMRQSGVYDFGAADLVARVFARGREQFLGPGFARTPPAELVFLQRKFVGTFLLCTRLRARVDLGALFDEWL